MSFEFTYKRLVQFSDTDMAGIMHFSRYLPIMEETEHALYRSLGYSVVPKETGKLIGWPRVHASCDYRMPFCYEDEIEVTLVVRRLGSKSIHYDALFRKAGENQIRAHGKMIVVCVEGDPMRSMKAVEIPPIIRSNLKAAPADYLADIDSAK